MTHPSTEYSHFHRRFLRLEDQLSLFDVDIGSLPIWERIRYPVALSLLQKKGIIGTVSTDSVSGLDKLRQGAKWGITNMLFYNPLLASPHEFLFVGEPRRKFHQGEWWDIYCDPIHDAADLDYVQVESTWNATHFRPARTERLRYIDLIRIFADLGHRSGLVNYQFTSTERQRLEKIETRIDDTFGIEFDIVGLARTTLNTRTVSKRLFDLILGRVRPKLVVLVGSAGKESFIEACHERDVPVAELQHGLFSPHSYMHSFPGNRTKRAYPDYFLTFGDFWTDIAAQPIPDERLISVGYPYLERAVRSAEGAADTKRIVFISTNENGRELSELAVDLSKRLDRSWEIAYKLHPNEYGRWQSLYPWLTDTPVRVSGQEGSSLYDLFTGARAQVGVSSTAVYEGLGFGLDTYLVPLPTVEWLTPILDEGDATVVESADELATNLRKTGENQVSYEKYFKPNATKHLVQTLQRLRTSGTMITAAERERVQR